jgi:PITH domain
VRLHSVLIRSSTHASAPRTLALHANQPNLDFSTATDLAPTQLLSLAQSNDVIEYPVKRALFNSTRSLALFVGENWGDGEEDVTRLRYLGFKGEWMRLSREPVSFLYEVAANPRDHTLAAGVKGGVGSSIHGAGGGSGF